ncbi:MAG: hypothetical protein KBA46_03425 [Candidatus Omnitrophica bacterium]|nr:hypothetical protein [Candidatus Omnitrophota bacterium]
MITLLIAGNEERIKQILVEMLQKNGNINLDITKQENIVKIISKVEAERDVTFEDKVIELEHIWHQEKRGSLYRAMLEKLEKPLFEHVLERSEGNQVKAARILGINRNTMRSKIKKLGIACARYKQ